MAESVIEALARAGVFVLRLAAEGLAEAAAAWWFRGTVRVLAPLLTFGRVRVERPYRWGRPLWRRGPRGVEIEAGLAGLIGFVFWIVAIVVTARAFAG